MTYLSIKEATEQTGKNEKTIRRLIKRNESKKYIQLKEGKLYINSDYLYNIYKPGHLSTQEFGHLSTQKDGQLDNIEIPENEENKPDYLKEVLKSKDDTIQLLSTQIDTLTRQLDNKDTTINQLIERTREQNIIIQSIQEKITKQLPASQQATSLNNKDKKNSITDNLLIAVALISAIALIGFIGLMIWAYMNK